MLWRRFKYKGPKERLPEIEAALKESGVTRKSMYLVLKYFEINLSALQELENQFPDI